LQGSGTDTQIIVSNNANINNAILVSNTNDVLLSDFVINANGQNQASGYNRGIGVDVGQNVQIRNVRVENAGGATANQGHGIVLWNCEECRVDNAYIEAQLDVGLYVGGSSNWNNSTTDITCKDSGARCVRFDGVDGGVIENITCEHSNSSRNNGTAGTCVSVGNGSEEIAVNGVQAWGNRGGTYESNDLINLANSEFISLTNCTVEDSGDNGVAVENSTDITITNCTARESENNGFAVGWDSSTSRVLFEDSVATNNCKNNTGSCGGFAITNANAGSLNDISFTNNTAHDTAGHGSKTQVHGLVVWGGTAGTITNIVIEGNNFSNNKAHGIAVNEDSGTTIEVVTVTDNILANNGESGVWIDLVQFGIIEGNVIFGNGDLPGGTYPYGIYMNSPGDWVIEDNLIQNHVHASGEGVYKAGIWTRTMIGRSNLLYANTSETNLTVHSFSVIDTTPNIAGSTTWITGSNTSNITDLDGAFPGLVVTIICTSACTFMNDDTTGEFVLPGSVDKACVDQDVFEFVYRNDKWYMVSWADNS
jgi:parallel beta-helix repeat protein